MTLEDSPSFSIWYNDLILAISPAVNNKFAQYVYGLMLRYLSASGTAPPFRLGRNLYTLHLALGGPADGQVPGSESVKEVYPLIKIVNQ